MRPRAEPEPIQTLHAVEYGRGGTPLVLLHGLGAGGSTWAAVAGRLAADRRLLVPDLLGFGRSPWPDVEYTVDDHLDALAALLARRGLGDERFDLAGHSMGAVLALELAARWPDRVRRLTLVSLPLFHSPAEVRAHAAQLGLLSRLTAQDHWAAALACGAMCLLRPLLLAVAPRFARHVPHEVARDALRHTYHSYGRSLQNVIVRHRIDPAAAALADRPVLLVHGDADRSAPLRSVRAFVDQWPAWRLEVVPGADHLLPIANPAAVARALAAHDAPRAARVMQPAP